MRSAAALLLAAALASLLPAARPSPATAARIAVDPSAPSFGAAAEPKPPHLFFFLVDECGPPRACRTASRS